MDNRLPKMWEVIFVLSVFLIMMTLSVAVFELSIQLPLFAAWFLLIAFGLRLKYSYQQLQASIIKGISNGLEATLVLFAVGALIGGWIAGGVVPALIYYGLEMIQPSIFLVATLVLCAITSLAVGTSFGTAGTVGVAMMGIGASLGIPLPLVAGAVISGAYIGDKLSPLSDTTVMTASLTRVDVIDHIRGMLSTTLPAIIGAAILYVIVGFVYVDGSADLAQAQMVSQSLQELFNIGWYTLIPVAATLLLLILRKPAIPVITFGALLGVLWAILFQSMDPVLAIETAYSGFTMDSGVEIIDSLLSAGGISAMLGVIAIILLALGLGGLMERMKILEAFSEFFRSWVHRAKNKRIQSGRLSIATVLAAFSGNLFGSAAYVSLITGVKITEKIYDDLKVDRRVLGRNTEAGGTLTAPLVPWSDAGVYMTAVLGVSTLQYLPYAWMNILGVLTAIIVGYLGKVTYKKAFKSTEMKDENLSA
ncbi:antiporter [Bacillaceae bacterium JMAK1]|nr:antiporter [Bacillaceae bacterium JMAK1]